MTLLLHAPQHTTPPVVAELQAVFSRLEDDKLIAALQGPTRRGPKGHPVRALWQCFVAKHVLGLASTAALIRELTNNPFVAQACGIESPDRIPHEATFSRFFAKLARKHTLPRVKDVSRALVRRHYATIPGFGQRVALDSTTLKGWANGVKGKRVDPHADWSIKRGTQGRNEFVFGWKLHLLVDCESELPMAANVTAGNVHDSQRATNLLSEARSTYSRFNPRYVLADAGYSGRPIINAVRRHFHSTPIIKTNPTHKHLHAKYRAAEESPSWKALYKQRQAVERAFSRLKGQRSLNSIKVRRRAKVAVHRYLSLIAMQAVGLHSRHARTGRATRQDQAGRDPIGSVAGGVAAVF